MITLTGKIIGAGYKKSKQTIYKFLVIKGEYDGTDLEGQKIEVYGAVNKLDPVQKRTILTVTGDFGRSRKNNLPRFKIQSISDLSSRLELDDIETFSKYLGISITQSDYVSALQELKVKNYLQAFQLMTDPKHKKHITDKYPAFARLVYYLSKEHQIIKVAQLFYSTKCGLDISHAVQVCNELQFRAGQKHIDELIKEHPWILTQVLDYNTGNEAAEIIAKYYKFSESKKTQGRISSSIISILFERNNRGDCFTLQSYLYARLLNKGFTFTDINDAIKYLTTGTKDLDGKRLYAGIIPVKENIYHICQDTGRQYSKSLKDPSKYQGYYLPGIFFSERAASKKLAQIITTPGEKLNHKNIIKSSQAILNKEQKKFIQTVCENKITCLTGEAGTGKTFVLKALINGYQKSTGQMPAVLAPTALASYRLGQGTIARNNSSTIHRYAHIFKQSDADLAVGDGWNVVEENQDIKLIIVDEGSMLGPTVLRRLLDTATPDTRIVFAGDPGQLPPVGADGTFPALLRLAEENVIAHVHLEENYRNGEDVIRIANSIRRNATNIPATDSVKLHICADKDIIPKLIDVVEENKGIGPDAMILVPFRKKERAKNTINVNTINHALGEKFNPGTQIGNTDFIVGDPIIARRNDYADDDNRYLPKMIRDIHYSRSNDVYNGMLGKIIDYEEETQIVTIKYHTGIISEQKYNVNELDYFVEKAYCTTVHKAQGGQAKKIILVLPNAQNNRSLIYTALTRCLIGGTIDIITTSSFTLLTSDPGATESKVDEDNLAAFQCLSSLKYMVLKELEIIKLRNPHKPFKSRKA
jgi:exodeoxyribonuclease V alpha subunit